MKPPISSLEAVALRNRLDLEFTINKKGLVQLNQAREGMMKGLMHRYEQLTGDKYIFLGYSRREEWY
ncbi:MAG TPA: hypothetical protein V6C58_04615 [Allocoleopsis sp.]